MPSPLRIASPGVSNRRPQSYTRHDIGPRLDNLQVHKTRVLLKENEPPKPVLLHTLKSPDPSADDAFRGSSYSDVKVDERPGQVEAPSTKVQRRRSIGLRVLSKVYEGIHQRTRSIHGTGTRASESESVTQPSVHMPPSSSEAAQQVEFASLTEPTHNRHQLDVGSPQTWTCPISLMNEVGNTAEKYS